MKNPHAFDIGNGIWKEKVCRLAEFKHNGIFNRTSLHTLQALHAFQITHILGDGGNIYGAFRFTASTICTFIFIYYHAQRREFIRDCQECAQRAEIFALEAFDQHRGNDEGDQNAD